MYIKANIYNPIYYTQYNTTEICTATLTNIYIYARNMPLWFYIIDIMRFKYSDKRMRYTGPNHHEPGVECHQWSEHTHTPTIPCTQGKKEENT